MSAAATLDHDDEQARDPELVNRAVVAVDAAGGDHGSEVTLGACAEALASDSLLYLQVVGDQDTLDPWHQALPEADAERVAVVVAAESVAMDESVGDALRRKTRSTMGRALELVFEGSADACVSAGNTGALMALARSILKTLPGVERPAICASLPSRRGLTTVLDLGANASVSADHLYQFAHMGTAVSRATGDQETPRVGLLNIGTESIKGNDTVRRAHQLLSDSALEYCGFAEGHDIFLGELDVVVCDGFTGNVALKCSEGISQLLMEELRTLGRGGVAGKAAATAARPAFAMMRKKFDPRHYNGASLLGLTGVVVKSHGAADVVGFGNAIATAAAEARAGLAERIGAEVVQLL